MEKRLGDIRNKHAAGEPLLPTDIAYLLATVEKLKASLEYCLDSMCKHDGEMRPGIGRKWCYQCSTWVCGSDLEQIVKARQALREI